MEMQREEDRTKGEEMSEREKEVSRETGERCG